MTLKQKFQNEIETESTASLNMGDVLSWGVLIFGEGQGQASFPGYRNVLIYEGGLGRRGA